MEKDLDKALKNAKKVSFDVNRDKYVVMSDQHIGDGKKGSDDFRKNREVYKNSLAHYFDNGYFFISIGDSEELWECDFPDVIGFYPDVYLMEKKFHDAGRLCRIHGNHDLFWRRSDFVNRYLQPQFNGIEIQEALLLEGAGGRIFLTHGHQGEFFSDTLWKVGRFFVRNVWKPFQRVFHVPSTGAAENIEKRGKKEQEYYNWAKGEKLLFIAGHTHRAMFGSLSKVDRIRMEIEKLIRDSAVLPAESGQYKANIEKIKQRKDDLQSYIKKEFGKEQEPIFEPSGVSSPCYFNDGCCSYDNGVTAIEIDSGVIRLVKWDRESSTPAVYEESNLRELFIKIELF